MDERIVLKACAAALLILACGSTAGAQQPKPTPARDGIEFFESNIRPVLVKSCYECHSAKSAKVKGSLYLDSRSGVLKGGENGPAIIPGDPNSSLLIQALHHKDLKMPKEKLPANVIADFEQWVRMGAPDPRTTDTAGWKKLTLEDAKTFWSFKPMKQHPLPTLKESGWAKTDVDRFILSRLEQKGLRPVADADRTSLIRRVTFDLIGLPPTPDEIDAFVNDKTADAYEKVVDRLLASRHFGERWGRYWLDVARYAESNGNADNTPFPHAWRYRDYVISSFNADKPYNRFVTEQIAGDLLPAENNLEKDANKVATGFLALTSKPRAQNNPDYRMDLVADQLDVTCRAIMSMTIICARCHDHKFDPIPTRDYYALAGIFDSSEMLSTGTAIKGLKGNGVTGLLTLSDGELAMGVKDGNPKDTAICVRGDSTKRGSLAERGFLTVAITPNTKPVNKTQSGRVELAAWITQPDHPLTSRVIVNRIWQHLFGQGLSRVVDNFGLHGEPPTHPELLDNLALKFQQDGWSIKKMVRQLVLTRTYRLSSAHSAENFKADPDNTLWWRIPARRLDAEAIRDAMLAVSGKITLTPPGRSLASAAAPPKKAKFSEDPAAKTATYRSVYLPIRRNGLPEALAIFDVADPSLIVGQRDVTTVPTQALYLMNSPFVIEQAQAFAQKILAAKDVDDAARINLAIRTAFGRPASAQEQERVRTFLRGFDGQGRNSGWTAFCQTLLASAEFRYVQ